MKKYFINKLLAFTIIFTIIFTQFAVFNTVKAVSTFTISPKAVSSSSLPKRITITSLNSFTAGNSTPYIMQNGSVVKTAQVSSVTSTADEVSFTLGAGLANGVYDIRIVDPKGTYDVGTITIGDPSISSISPTSLAKDYSNQEITVTGVNTNFTLGKTSVEILDSQNQVMNYVDFITSVDSNTNLTFKLKDGLPSGTYSIRVTTDDEIITAVNALEVRGTPSISISPNNISEGYSTTTINVTGVNTGFSQTQTTVSIIGKSNIVGSIVVNNENSLSFSLNSGLEPGVYTVEVSTGNEVVQTTLSVNSVSASLRYQGLDLDKIPAGYISPYNLVLVGTNTSFSSGITQLNLYNGNPDSGGTDITATYISNINVSNNTNISFQLETGLPVGTYYVRAVTGSQIVEDTFTVDAPQITNVEFVSDVVSGNNIPEGYKKMTVEITGTNTLFRQGTTTVEIQELTGKTETVVVEDSTHLSFSLKEGLSAGNYTIVIDIDGDSNTSSDKATYQFTVTSPTIVSVSPNTIVNAGSTPITITVIGDMTHFSKSIPIIEILDDQQTAISEVTISNVEVINDTKLTFNLIPNTIIMQGNYGIKITTSSSLINEVVQGSSLIKVNTAGISSISPSSVYKDELGNKEITITGINTNFIQDNTTLTIDNNPISNVNIISTSQLNFTIPNESYLTEGTHTIKVVDGNGDEFETSILIAVRSISISPKEKDFGYSSFTMLVTGEGLTFNTTDKKPSLTISGYGGVTLSDSEINSTQFTFNFPEGLEAGDYTITVIWNGLSFTDTFTVNETINQGQTQEDQQEQSEEQPQEQTQEQPQEQPQIPIIPLPIIQEEPQNPEENLEFIQEDSEKSIEEKVLEDGIIINQIIYDEQKTLEAINNLASNSFNIIEEEISNVEIKLPYSIVNVLKEKDDDMSVIVKSNLAEYILPVDVIDMDEIKNVLKDENISIDIIIKEPSKQVINEIEDVVKKQNMKLLTAPVEFKIEASASEQNKIEINNFKSKYITRKITLNTTVDVNKVVGVVFDEENNMFIHVPTKIVNENGNYVAYLKRKGNSIYTLIESQKTFEDIVNHWAKDNIEILASKLIINGKNENEFAPNENITRAEFAALLVRALGLKTNETSSNNFSDIEGKEWFAKVVSTAVDEGLVTGYDDGTFKPYKTISREEMAVMVTRALKVAGRNITVDDNELNTLLNKFDDKSIIANWAKESVAIASKEGIITGKTYNTFVPKDNATRAEAATMLIRMMKAVDFIN
ncbi:S-layer homology domain-containing protein [Caloranaerobacter ferrireducens]|uniref:S-layer homology domain-containing protein n=1 Tax=Caloranaerobacter ferrireducens TaxID=1323370 RepID=UPI00084D3FC9|nr:S-layer homology domain-containing protein [Caloranaerobacter ferrireducens]